MSLVPAVGHAAAVGLGSYLAKKYGHRLVRKYGAKAAKATVKRVIADSKKPKTVTSLERKIGVSRAMPPRRNTGPPQKRQRSEHTYDGGFAGGYSQMESRKYRTGRKQTLKSITDSLMKRNLALCVSEFKNLGPEFTGDMGAYAIGHNIDGGVARRYMPVYLFDLTRTALAGQPCAHRLYMHTTGGDDGKCAWMAVNGLDANGATSTIPYELYRNSVLASTNRPYSIHYGKISIGINLYGQTARPTKFTVSLVQFKDEEALPISDDGENSVTTISQNGNSFWQPRLKALVANPLASQPSAKRKDLKVIRTKTFSIGPTSTTESDPDPHIITVKWTHSMNKVLNMRKYQPTVTDDSIVVDATKSKTDVATSAGAGENLGQSTPHGKDRVYLLVQANAWTPVTAPTTLTSANTPSFDVVLRTTYRYAAN